MDLVFFGIQGSGKGTQAARLAGEFGYEIFEAGGELRKIAASATTLGQTVKSFVDVGRLVPHKIIMQVVEEAVRKHPKSAKLIFDGIPRDPDQMRDFDAIMADAKRPFMCIHFLLNDEEAVRRLVGRAKIQGRVDDAKTETIQRRMETFKTKTLPVIQEYDRQGRLIEIDGSRNIEDVYKDVQKMMKQKKW